LIRGRAWIAVIAFALIGIVAAQLWVVKLNVGIGRAIEHVATLQRENSELAIEDSALSSGERIEQLASARGMVPAPPGALHFDTVRGPLDVRLAVAALARPVQPQAASSSSTTTGTETNASTTTGGETASAGATTAQSTPTETSPATAESASAPAAAAATTAAAPSTTAASTPEPSATGGASEAASAPAATGGASEAPASAPAGGGTQAAPGG
jgi:cell division protein FtsL